jgi:glycogen operon protein
MNAHHDVVRFKLPETTDAVGWQLLIDTNIPDDEAGAHFKIGHQYQVTARSLLLFELDRQ